MNQQIQNLLDGEQQLKDKSFNHMNAQTELMHNIVQALISLNLRVHQLEAQLERHERDKLISA